MDFKSTIDLIIKDLNEASAIIDDLKKYPGVPALQVELAKSKCRSAGEVIALLKNLSDFAPVKQETIPEKQIVTPPVTHPEKKIEPKEPVKKTQSVPIVADKFGHVPDNYKENPEVS